MAETKQPNELPTLAILGPGRVGTALGVLARRAGYPVVIGGRDRRKALAAAQIVGASAKVSLPAEAASEGQIVLLTVNDHAIQDFCRTLAAEGAFSSGAVIAHCSGSLSSEVLGEARRRGCAIGSMHPLQTFPTVEAAVARLVGAFFFCEGDEPAIEALTHLAEALGGRPVRLVNGQKKGLYHAAAAMACNHLTSLVDGALTMMISAGVPRREAFDALMPLVQATVENIAKTGPEAALTGPIARGDSQALQKHVQGIAESQLPEELRRFYFAAALWTVDLAMRKGTLTKDAAQTLRRLLTDKSQES